MLGRLRVLLVEDASLTRDSLAALLGTEPGVDVIGAVAASVHALRLATVARPDLAIVDFAPTGGAAIIAAIHELWPSARVLVLACSDDERTVDAALQAGAGGYVLRSDTRAELMTALHRVSEGRPFVSRTVRDRVARLEAMGRTRLATDGLSLLTDREREIMQCVASGLRTREIAQRLSLSHKTVEKHRSNLMRKLGLRSAAAVAAYAIAKGYGSP